MSDYIPSGVKDAVADALTAAGIELHDDGEYTSIGTVSFTLVGGDHDGEHYNLTINGDWLDELQEYWSQQAEDANNVDDNDTAPEPDPGDDSTPS